MSLRVRRLDRFQAFADLSRLWDQLARETGETSPFLSHGWFSCCWGALSSNREAEVLVVEETGSPLAVVPLARTIEVSRGLRVRSIGFLDCPDTPFADLLGAGERGAMVDAVLDHLAARSDWDLLSLRNLRAGSTTLKALEDRLPARFAGRRTTSVLSPYLAIDGSWPGFYAAKSRRFRKTGRNVQNRLERAGRVGIEEHRTVDPDGPLFEAVVDLTSRSWKAERGVAIATMPRMREFFARLTRLASERDWLSLWLLRLDDRPVAMEYQLREAGIVHALRADFDARFRELSPGSALNFAIARALFERGGVREYDMGAGPNEYKLRWASACHERVHLEAYGRTLGARGMRVLEGTLEALVNRLRGGRP